jgi:photosystem II stability/assembly factor-like uncharacterized protein
VRMFPWLEPLAVAAVLGTWLVPGVASPGAYTGAEAAPKTPSAFASLAFDMFDGGDVWAGNGAGIWRTDDNGKRWYNITPANLVGDDPAVRLTGFGWFGSQHLWFSATEAGDVTKQGLRGFAIERSSDGGRTWHWTALPSCADCSVSFSFVDATHGFALGSNGNLYSTLDAGSSWSMVPSQLPKSNAPALDFITRDLGWSSFGGLLERTTDGGKTWRRLSLPGPVPLALSAPHFFSAAAGIVASDLPSGKGVIYATSDGGDQWRNEPLPAAPNAPSPSTGWFTAPAFEVSSAVNWAVTSGRKLFVTGDAGQGWAEVPTPPTYGKGDPIWGFAMSSTSLGWLAAAATPCGANAQDLCSVPVLLRTTNQGRSWRIVPSSSQAAAAPSSLANLRTIVVQVVGPTPTISDWL